MTPQVPFIPRYLAVCTRGVMARVATWWMLVRLAHAFCCANMKGGEQAVKIKQRWLYRWQPFLSVFFPEDSKKNHNSVFFMAKI
ncbi:hypothetical protein [Pseudomonas sp. CMR5c]|uniref:hypothetical protein n=1 Tax=Pseudomonas TaxID=286 RepID=UPI000F571778|nr:hypothetical protein [Pseudomonas sp. CMR5c]